MTRARFLALAAPAGFAVLAGVLASLAALPKAEAVAAVVSVLLAFAPTAWVAPGGWRRRAAEAALLPVAFALTMVADPTSRRLLLPPLLLLAASAATAAAIRRAGPRRIFLLVALLGLSARAATGLGLIGEPLWRSGLAVGTAMVIAWATTRALGPAAATTLTALAAVSPLERAPHAALAVAAAGILLGTFGTRATWIERRAQGWVPAALALALVAATLSPWGGIAPARAFPAAHWPALATLAVALAATPFLPPAAAGAAWLGAAATLGPPQPAPPDRAGVTLTATSPRASLPTASGGLYLIESALANAAAVPAGTTVARVTVGTMSLPVRAGRETAEWAHERADVRALVAHPLPADPVWRPGGLGAASMWGVAGRMEGAVPEGTPLAIERDAGLPAKVNVTVMTAGSSRPTPPRDWPLPRWLLACAVTIALLQVAGGTWRRGVAFAPWALLVTLALAARMPVEPLRLLAERHAVDVVLLALLATWFPLAAVWLRRGRVFLTAAALLVPLAVATPHLTPPLYGDEPFHLIVLDSLVHDHDLDLSNNYDLQHHPYNRIYVSGIIFLHSPVLALLLSPGFAAAGRAGALALLAMAGAGVVALVARRAGELGCPPRRLAFLVTGLLLTYPLATFSSQIWPEVPGALTAVAAVVLINLPRPRRGTVAGLLALAAAVKTRLGLVMFPLAVAAWWPKRLSASEVRRAAVVLLGAAAAGLAVSWATFGHPLGFRRVASLLPREPRLALTALGGLVFDPAGGLLFSAPLLLLGLAGSAALLRRGGRAERALLVGGALTVLALLPSVEWYGGGSPPARYLVPLLPIFALGSAAWLGGAARWRGAAAALLPPSVLVWWGLITRPHFSVNPGDGGWWLADALARRFSADARHLLPSFLRPSPATVIVPLLVIAVVAGLALAVRRRADLARGIGRLAPTIALLTAAIFILVLVERHDRVVEIEDPQVAHRGGEIEPPAGTYSRFLRPNGWRVKDGEGVDIPLNLPGNGGPRLEGWVEGEARAPVAIVAAWDGLPGEVVSVRGRGRGSVVLPAAPSPGRHWLSLTLQATGGGEAVLDRLVVAP